MTIKGRNPGAEKSAKVQREKAIRLYYSNPNFCKNCECIIEVLDGAKVSEIRRKKFCGSSCAATYNNYKRANRNASIKKCEFCNKNFHLTKRKNRNTYYPRRYCDNCVNLVRALNKTSLPEMTKKELFDKNKNWQSARSSLQKQARKIFYNSNKKKSCIICGYDKHVEVAHVKAVSEFPDDAKVNEINSIDNLEALCPNHHWEYDNDLLDLKKYIAKIY